MYGYQAYTANLISEAQKSADEARDLRRQLQNAQEAQQQLIIEMNAKLLRQKVEAAYAEDRNGRLNYITSNLGNFKERIISACRAQNGDINLAKLSIMEKECNRMLKEATNNDISQLDIDICQTKPAAYTFVNQSNPYDPRSSFKYFVSYTDGDVETNPFSRGNGLDQENKDDISPDLLAEYMAVSEKLVYDFLYDNQYGRDLFVMRELTLSNTLQGNTQSCTILVGADPSIRTIFNNTYPRLKEHIFKFLCPADEKRELLNAAITERLKTNYIFRDMIRAYSGVNYPETYVFSEKEIRSFLSILYNTDIQTDKTSKNGSSVDSLTSLYDPVDLRVLCAMFDIYANKKECIPFSRDERLGSGYYNEFGINQEGRVLVIDYAAYLLSIMYGINCPANLESERKIYENLCFISETIPKKTPTYQDLKNALSKEISSFVGHPFESRYACKPEEIAQFQALHQEILKIPAVNEAFRTLEQLLKGTGKSNVSDVIKSMSSGPDGMDFNKMAQLNVWVQGALSGLSAIRKCTGNAADFVRNTKEKETRFIANEKTRNIKERCCLSESRILMDAQCKYFDDLKAAVDKVVADCLKHKDRKETYQFSGKADNSLAKFGQLMKACHSDHPLVSDALKKITQRLEPQKTSNPSREKATLKELKALVLPTKEPAKQIGNLVVATNQMKQISGSDKIWSATSAKQSPKISTKTLKQ